VGILPGRRIAHVGGGYGFVSPPEVIAALQERVEHGVFGYPMVTKEMKEVVVQRMAARYAWKNRSVRYPIRPRRRAGL